MSVSALSPKSEYVESDDSESDSQTTPPTSPTMSSQASDEWTDASEDGEEQSINKSENASENETKVAPPSTKGSICSSPVPRNLPTKDSPKEKAQSWSDIFVPKIRLIRILLELDFIAGCILIVNTMLQGGINSMKTTSETKLTASMLELIVTKKFDPEATVKLLFRLIVLQVVFHSLAALNQYAQRRSRRPLQKRLLVDLMEGYANLPYEMMSDQKVDMKFFMVFFHIWS